MAGSYGRCIKSKGIRSLSIVFAICSFSLRRIRCITRVRARQAGIYRQWTTISPEWEVAAKAHRYACAYLFTAQSVTVSLGLRDVQASLIA